MQEQTRQHIPSLDGIRAVSILIVVLSHAGYHQIPGGFGVTIFFFLSGYLITTLLIAEQTTTGTISIQRFFLRRALRLMPALIITLIVAYTLTIAGVLPGGVTLAGVASQLFYFANYYAIFYAEERSIPAGTGILWSLAVEEHYYALFPFFMALTLPRMRVGHICSILFVICLAVLCWRIFLTTHSDFKPERTYYGTDTRVDSILFGCILALMWQFLPQNSSYARHPFGQGVLFIISGALLAFSFLYRDEMFRETFRYTVQGIALMPLFWLAIRYPQRPLGLLLNNEMMNAMGKLSYTIYLVHLIVIELLRQTAGISSTWLVLVLGLSASILYALVLDKTVETYFRPLRARLRC